MSIPSILIRDPISYSSRLHQIDPSRLVVVTDFDHTITCAKPLSVSCFYLMGTIAELGEGLMRERDELFREYYPYEIDPHIDPDQRDIYMTEWWERSMLLHERYHLQRSHLDQIDYSRVVVREGWGEFLRYCHEQSIPVYIVSAGITQVIEGVLTHHGMYYDNITIISNTLEFDPDGNYAGCMPRSPIHTGNKCLHTSDITLRDHVILLGDQRDDVHMISRQDDRVLRVGFHDTDTAIAEGFAQVYDVIVPHPSGDMGYLGTLTETLTTKK